MTVKKSNFPDVKVLEKDSFSHGIDWLSLSLHSFSNINPFFTSRLYNLDSDNASFWVVQFADENLSIQKAKSSTWDSFYFSVSYLSISVPIFCITKYNSHISQLTGAIWIIHFYGAYFRLISLEYISDFFQAEIKMHLKDCPISRIDYRFDFLWFEPSSVPTAMEVFPKMRANKKWKVYLKPATWEIESWELWSRVNKTIFTRFYDKNLELSWNLKSLFLYWDIISKYKTFHRLEFEFLYKYCHWYTLETLWQLIQNIYNTTGILESTHIWNNYSPQIKLDLTDEIQKNRFIKIFVGMASRLKENWIDPHDVLTSALVQDNQKKCIH